MGAGREYPVPFEARLGSSRAWSVSFPCLTVVVFAERPVGVLAQGQTVAGWGAGSALGAPAQPRVLYWVPETPGASHTPR